MGCTLVVEQPRFPAPVLVERPTSVLLISERTTAAGWPEEEEKPKPPDKLEGAAVLLCLKEDNYGTLFVRYFVARKEIPKFTFRSVATSRKTLLRGASGKKLY